MSTWNTAEGVDFRGPLDLTRAATAVLDAQGIILGWSPKAEDLFGYPPRDVLGMPMHRLLEVAEGEEADVRHRDGRTVRVATATCPLPLAGTGPASVLLAAELGELRQWETDQAVLRALLDQSPTGLTVYDTGPQVVWANATCKRELAGGPEDYVGARPDALFPGGEILSPGQPGTVDEVVAQVLETGTTVTDLHVRARPPEDPERDRVWSCSYYRLEGPRHETLGVCEESFDITDRYRTEQRLHLLVRAGERIGTTLDIHRTAEELAGIAVPQLAGSVVVDVFGEVLEGREPEQPAAADRLVRVESRTSASASARDAGAGATGGAGTEVARGERPHYPRGSPQARSLATGRTLGDGTGTGTGTSPGTDAITPSRTLVIPLRSRGPVLGLVTFTRETGPDAFDGDDAALADELVRRTAVCVDNARRYISEHAAALTLQRSLLPQRLPSLSAVDSASRYLPADDTIGVGGDWFDVIPLSGARVGLVVGDVVGHGLRAAATMGRLRSTVRAFAQLDLAPDELLSRLDDLVTQADEERGLVEGDGEDQLLNSDLLGMTCLYGVYDPVAQRCAFARAGHPVPAVVSPEGRVSFAELPPGPPLGTGGLPFESAELELAPESLLALFTDGLVESRALDVDEGLTRLEGVLAGHRQPLEELCDEIVTALPSGSPTDDAALLLVRTHALGPEQVASWELPADPARVSDVRAKAGRRLEAWGLDHLVFSTELVVSELVTNAVRHASGPVHLRLIRDRTLICEVADTGHTSPHLRHAASDDEGGRGLFLVAQMTQRWGTRYTDTGKVIWAEQPLTSVEPADALLSAVL